MAFTKNAFLRLSLAPVRFMLMKTAYDGAQTIIQAAVADEEADVTGKIYALVMVTQVGVELVYNGHVFTPWKLN